MPELPDITVYVEALRRRIVGQPLEEVRLKTPFLLRTVEPPLTDLIGKRVTAVERLGKRIVLEMEGALFVVIHLMIAGRLHWKARGAKSGGRSDLAAFEFPGGMLSLTEAGTKRRASLHLVRGRGGLAEFKRGGLEPLDASLEEFAARLRSENHTVKRSLTDPRLFSGIGNAYSDEILHAARLSPLRLTRSLSGEESGRLLQAARSLLGDWCARLPLLYPGFPKPADVTAFRLEFAVHGRYGLPCPDCGSPVQRVVYAENETSYCAKCQNEGRLLADRALSRLLKADWPRTLEEMVGS